MSEYRQQGQNYQRWYLAVYQENPELFPGPQKFKRYLKLKIKHQEELEKLDKEIGGSDE